MIAHRDTEKDYLYLKRLRGYLRVPGEAGEDTLFCFD